MKMYSRQIVRRRLYISGKRELLMPCVKPFDSDINRNKINFAINIIYISNDRAISGRK